jgi:hypothetical protein
MCAVRVYVSFCVLTKRGEGRVYVFTLVQHLTIESY